MRIAAVLIGAGLLAASPAAADIPVSPLEDIYLSFNDCLEVAQPKGLDLEKLSSLGWVKATMTDAAGKPIAGPDIYGNPKRKPIVLLSKEGGPGVCIVMARIESAASYGKFLEAWGGKLPAPDKEGAITFFDGNRPVQLRQTGTADKPSLTVAVMVPEGAK